jgi:hypothetical protein
MRRHGFVRFSSAITLSLLAVGLCGANWTIDNPLSGQGIEKTCDITGRGDTPTEDGLTAVFEFRNMDTGNSVQTAGVASNMSGTWCEELKVPGSGWPLGGHQVRLVQGMTTLAFKNININNPSDP